MRVLVPAVVVEDAACDDAEVFREIERSGDDEEGEKEEEYGVCDVNVSKSRFRLLRLFRVARCAAGGLVALWVVQENTERRGAGRQGSAY